MAHRLNGQRAMGLLDTLAHGEPSEKLRVGVYVFGTPVTDQEHCA